MNSWPSVSVGPKSKRLTNRDSQQTLRRENAPVLNRGFLVIKQCERKLLTYPCTVLATKSSDDDLEHSGKHDGFDVRATDSALPEGAWADLGWIL